VVLERDPTDFSFHIVLYFLGLIFRDMLFLSPHIRTLIDLWEMHIPAHRECIPVEWHLDWLNTSILRWTTRSKENGQVVVSRNAALQYFQVRKRGRRLGREFGLEKDFELKVLRRGATQGLSSKLETSVVANSAKLIVRNGVTWSPQSDHGSCPRPHIRPPLSKPGRGC
jgi:Protein of unknown function (DUF3435)